MTIYGLIDTIFNRRIDPADIDLSIRSLSDTALVRRARNTVEDPVIVEAQQKIFWLVPFSGFTGALAGIFFARTRWAREAIKATRMPSLLNTGTNNGGEVANSCLDNA